MVQLSNAIQILLIEDDLIDQEHYCRVFGGIDHISVSTAKNLHDGIQLIRSGSFDVVVFDLGLPDSYGIDTVKRMVEEFPTLPMIVLTGSNDIELAESAKGLGVRGYLVKGKASNEEIIASVNDATT